MTTKVCSKCGIEKPLGKFYMNGKYRRSVCGACFLASQKQYCKDNKEKCKIRRKNRYIKNRLKVAAYYAVNKKRIRAYYKTYYKTKQKQLRVAYKKWHNAIKEEVFNAYGNRCVCCGETKKEFLTIDHINNDGREHREKVGAQGVYLDIKKQGFPKDKYRILCMNCNHSLGIHGYCPHNLLDVKLISLEDYAK